MLCILSVFCSSVSLFQNSKRIQKKTETIPVPGMYIGQYKKFNLDLCQCLDGVFRAQDDDLHMYILEVGSTIFMILRRDRGLDCHF